MPRKQGLWAQDFEFSMSCNINIILNFFPQPSKNVKIAMKQDPNGAFPGTALPPHPGPASRL